MNLRYANRLTRWTPAPILVVAALALAPAAALASAPCANEAVRAESNINPATHEPYSLGLPECRAYEMVSPLEKGGSKASGSAGLPAAINGNAVGFVSQNAFGDAEGYALGALGVSKNPYVSRRTASGWETSSALPPAKLVADPNYVHGVGGDASPDLSQVATCGLAQNVVNLFIGVDAVCALREQDGSWVGSPRFSSTTGGTYGSAEESVPKSLEYQGGSSDLSHLIFESNGGSPKGAAFLPADTSEIGGDGLYEVTGLDGASPELRLVNVNNSGEEIGPAKGTRIGGIGGEGGEAVACASISTNPYVSSSYQAISSDGHAIYFTACPSNTTGGVNTIFARINGRETIAISNPSPSQCTTCNATPASAAFEGASSDGSKAFFLTSQQLVNKDTDNTTDLYEYNFDSPPGHNIVQLSAGGAGDLTPGVGAEVQGVVRTSSDGSHVYFVAKGVLTIVPNAEGESAQKGANNLYGVDTETGETHFVAKLAVTDTALWGNDAEREAQSTPDGGFLVFATFAKLITSGSEADTNEAQQVYRYDFETGDLVRVSIGEPSFQVSDNGNIPGLGATIAPLPAGGFAAGLSKDGASDDGALADINDYNRAISASGSTIIFATPEALQANDTNTGPNPSCSTTANATGCDVYEWHECPSGACADGMAGEVSMISPGDDPTSADTEDGRASLSESGDDIFFFSSGALVGQDRDALVDLYDARIDGGFPAPSEKPSCSGEACQGNPSAYPAALKPEGSATQQPGGNLTVAPFKETLEPEPKPKPKSKPLTNAQKLAAALKVCKKTKSKTKRQACVRHARKEFSRSRKKKK